MNKAILILFAGVLVMVVAPVSARAANQNHELAVPETGLHVVGKPYGDPALRKALQDTAWIEEWSFDNGAPCNESGWTHVDNRILFSGDEYWHIETGFSTTTGMTGNSYAVGYHGNPCCEDVDGYSNDWYQGIRITYTGAANISFDYTVDSESGFDFLQIESDSACSSYDRVNYSADPSGTPGSFRVVEARTDGLVTDGEFVNQTLTDYGAGTHCVYIAFFTDGAFSPCDGYQPTTIGEGAVIDNISVTDNGGTRTETFEDGTLDIGVALDMADPVPFGTWARLFDHITDNDICSENTTCAWLWTDDTTPSLFNDPSMAFAPGGYVVKSWLDDGIVSPWVSLATTPTATGTLLEFRLFAGNFSSTSRIVHNWSVRGLSDMDTCATTWGHSVHWNSLSSFNWQSLVLDLSAHFDPEVTAIQLRHRTSDWQWIAGATPPVSFIPGPGPFIDRVRIGRRIVNGPVISTGIDTRSQAQDCFPTEIDPTVTPAGDHYRPTTDRFGTCAFSEGTELGINYTSPNLITGDSIWVNVEGIRVGGDSIVSVQWCGAIVRGPHAGKAPPPYTVGGNGFFILDADSVRSASGATVRDFYFVDLDDEYFRGGDELHYFWAATDNGGGFTSNPVGLTAMPVSIGQASLATLGLREVSYLPAINWDPAYVARIQADPNGKLDPTPGETSNSTQESALLYVNYVNPSRRSGDLNRTAFMYTLESLGFNDEDGTHYDVFDHQGMGNPNNQLAGRATIQQCQGYKLIVYDVGNASPGAPILPDGSDLDGQKIDQAGWFSAWLHQASLSEAGFATLWFLGSNIAEEKSSMGGSAAALLNTDMGVTLQSPDQALNVNPDVLGVANFTFDNGPGSSIAQFTGDEFSLSGGCPVVRNYDGLDVSSGTSVATHRFRSPTNGTLGAAAVVMNRNNAEAFNTILMSFPWEDVWSSSPPAVHSASKSTRTLPEVEDEVKRKTVNEITDVTLPPPDCGCSCDITCDPTGVPDEDHTDAPLRTLLYQNVPNPFNPVTTIHFDLARGGPVSLKIYDVAGRLVRTLAQEEIAAGRDIRRIWDGLDDHAGRVASGLYFCSLETRDSKQMRRMVLLR